jgi:hypothetical protein
MPDLRRAIESHCGPLTDEGPVAQADWNGRLTLLHYDQKVGITEPLHLGVRLPTEDAHPLDHPDGIGIVAGIAPLGFSVPVLMHGTPDGGTQYRWTATQFPETGPVQERIRKHRDTHKRAAGDCLENATVVRREDGGYDRRAW